MPPRQTPLIVQPVHAHKFTHGFPTVRAPRLFDPALRDGTWFAKTHVHARMHNVVAATVTTHDALQCIVGCASAAGAQLLKGRYSQAQVGQDRGVVGVTDTMGPAPVLQLIGREKINRVLCNQRFETLLVQGTTDIAHLHMQV